MGSLALPTYFLISSLAFIAALFFLVKRSTRFHVSRNLALDAALALMIFGFVGSRLFHVFFEEPAYYAEDWTRVFDVWRGGFVWYGGALLGSLASIGFLKWKGERLGKWLDLFAPVGALGYAIGRFACLLAGCCYGDLCVIGESQWRYPTQAFAIVAELGILVLLLQLEKRRTKYSWLKREGQLFCVWLVCHGLSRVVMEFFRGDPRGAPLAGLSVSTWISTLLVVGAAGVLVRRARKS